MTTTKSFLVLSAAVAVAIFAFVGVANADTLYRQLEEGNSGADVSSLQTFLAKDRTIYPQGLVTGYFGSLTKSAVSNFQARNGIATVGRVGPVTLVAINAQMGGNLGGDVNAPIIWGVTQAPGINSASIRWNTSEQAAGIVYYSTSYPSMIEGMTDVTISGSVAMTDTLLRTSQSVSIAGLQPNTTYYYVIYTRDGSGNVQVTWPATFRTTN
ncbi:MAG: peptidoglycan-binding protein [Patescibacteria group bacterium]